MAVARKLTLFKIVLSRLEECRISDQCSLAVVGLRGASLPIS